MQLLLTLLKEGQSGYINYKKLGLMLDCKNAAAF